MAKANTDELVEEVEHIRLRLAGTVDELIDRTNPKNAARRSLINFKSRFVTDEGAPKMETIIPVALGVVGFIGALILIRRIVR